MTKYEFTFESNNNERIDKFLSINLTDLSRSYIQKSLKDRYVLVNDKVVKPNMKLKNGDKILFSMPPIKDPEILAENIPLDILFEDEDILILNKGKNMVVHPAPGHYSGTLVNAVMHHCKDSLSGINGVMRPGIVHRIDMNTTGSIIICKNDKSHQAIANQLKSHEITRKYRAIVHGIIKDDSGTIEGPIGRDDRERKKMSINHRNGKDAITHYKVIKRYRDYTYIECQLETGRTHQIRVHMASIMHPLLGDDTYTNRKSKYNLTGQTLHAHTLGFIHPKTNEYVEYQAELPDYFKKLLNIIPE